MKKIIQLGDKTYVLIFDNFEKDEIDIDSLLKIDYSNLIGELITFPVIVNRFGQLLAEAESKVSETKLNLDVFEAKIKEKIRKECSDVGTKITVEALNNSMLCNAAYQAMARKLIDVQKTRDYLNSIFWSAKDKSSKLDKLSLTIQASDIPDSVLEKKVNNVLIKKAKKVID